MLGYTGYNKGGRNHAKMVITLSELVDSNNWCSYYTCFFIQMGF